VEEALLTAVTHFAGRVSLLQYPFVDIQQQSFNTDSITVQWQSTSNLRISYLFAMSTPVRPSTPAAQSAPSTPTTGTWKHPKLDEIVRRQNAARFSADDLKKVLYNIAGIAVVCLLGRSVWDRCVSTQPPDYTRLTK
jgi:hypothetical protein